MGSNGNSAGALQSVALTESALDIWWLFSSVLGAAIVGLFLLGLIVPTLRNRQAVFIFGVGLAIIGWMTLSTGDWWPALLNSVASPFHPLLVVVVGPAAMMLLGLLLAPKEADTV